jgi:hypothetical protein
MSACCGGAPRRRRPLARASRGAAWFVPVLTLVLMPKCPLCLAAWFTLLTGVALPPSAAAGLRVTLIAASLVALAVLAVRCARRAHRTFNRSRSP